MCARNKFGYFHTNVKFVHVKTKTFSNEFFLIKKHVKNILDF